MLDVFLVAVLLVTCFIGVLPWVLAETFTPVAILTGIIVRVEPFGKKVRRRGGRRSSVVLTIEITRLMLKPVDMPPILAPSRGPTVAFLFLLVVLLISAVFFGFLLNWK
jgi:hypothetical protein